MVVRRAGERREQGHVAAPRGVAEAQRQPVCVPFLLQLQHEPAVAGRDGPGVLQQLAAVAIAARHGIGTGRAPQAGHQPRRGGRRDEARLRGLRALVPPPPLPW